MWRRVPEQKTEELVKKHGGERVYLLPHARTPCTTFFQPNPHCHVLGTMFYKHALGPIYPMPSKDPWNAVAYIDGCCMNNGRAGARVSSLLLFHAPHSSVPPPQSFLLLHDRRAQTQQFTGLVLRSLPCAPGSCFLLLIAPLAQAHVSTSPCSSKSELLVRFAHYSDACTLVLIFVLLAH